MRAAPAPAPQPERKTIWRPNAGPQRAFLEHMAQESLYGGAAGGGKSAAAVSLPLRWIKNPRYLGVYLRREAKYLMDAILKSHELYPKFGATFVQSPKMIWTFPSGAMVWLNHCEHDTDIMNYDSIEISELIFEELTHFTEKQYRGLRARLRGTDPTLPYWSRATTNPGGPGHDWVKKRFGAWLDKDHPNRAADGEARWYLKDKEVPRDTPDALSRTFIGARLSDNPHVSAGYRATLLDLDEVRSKQLADGDWSAAVAPGVFFQRGWYRTIEALPKVRMATVRYWDRSGTVDGDWTVGLKMTRLAPNPTDLDFVILDVARMRGGPGEVENYIKATAALDGRGVTQWLEQDPGSAGISEVRSLTKALAGFPVRSLRPTGDKVTRARPFSGQVRAGNVGILYPGGVAPAWVDTYFREVEAFPDPEKQYWDWDDQVDAGSGAFNVLNERGNPGASHELVTGEDRRSMDGFV